MKITYYVEDTHCQDKKSLLLAEQQKLCYFLHHYIFFVVIEYTNTLFSTNFI